MDFFRHFDEKPRKSKDVSSHASSEWRRFGILESISTNGRKRMVDNYILIEC